MNSDLPPSSNWDRIADIYNDALDLPREQRDAFVRRACDGNQELQREVESLLSREDDQRFDRPAIEIAADDIARQSPFDVSLEPRFTILKTIARSNAAVYLARDNETDAVVAVKVLDRQTAARADLIENCKREVLLSRKVTHKNVCRVYDLCRVGDAVAISMEYVEGESLRTLLSRPQGVSMRHAADIVRQICAGLEEAHAQGVIHRDLKPENILVARDGTVKLIDFGIARALDSGRTVTGEIKGTPAYMSPEQASGKTVDARTDIYSLGLILYEMFCGRRAFDADTPVALAFKHVNVHPDPPQSVDPYLPGWVDRVILRCLEKNPARRFQSVAELAQAFTAQTQVAGPVAAAESHLPVRLSRWQLGDWVLAGAAVLAVILFAWLFEENTLARHIQVRTDRAVFARLAQETAGQIGAPVGTNSSVHVSALPDHYEYVATHFGARAAYELADKPVPYLVWHVEWDNGTAVDLDDSGAVVGFARNFEHNQTVAPISTNEAKEIAAAAVRDHLRLDPAAFRLQPVEGGIWRESQTVTLTWSDPGEYRGLRRYVIVRLVGRQIASLESRFTIPGGYVNTNNRIQLLGYLLVPFVMICIGVSQRAYVQARASWRTALTWIAAAMIAQLAWWMLWNFNVPASIAFAAALNSGIAVGVVMPFILTALERIVPRLGPHKLSTTMRLFGGKALSEPCGLAVLRGSFLGLCLVAIDTMLVWLGTNHLGMWMDSSMLNIIRLYHEAYWPAAQNAVIGIGGVICFSAYMGWLTSLIAALVPRPLMRAVLSALALVVIFPSVPITSTIGLLQPLPQKLPLVLVEYVVLLWVLYRFDFLTLGAALATFVFMARNYFNFIMLQPTGAVAETAGFVIWGLIVAAAAVVTFQSGIRAAFRRVMAAV